MPTVLSTKKLAPSQKSLLLNSGIGLVEYDALNVKGTNFLWNKKFKNNLIFTSQNAFKAILKTVEKEVLNDSRIYCVGEKTKNSVLASGLKVEECEANAADLGKKIASEHKNKSFTYFCGNIRRDELPQILAGNNIKFEEVEVYTTSLNKRKFDQDFDGVLFFSPSGVESFFSLNSEKSVVGFCIGKTTSAALEKYASLIITAKKPSIENVIVQVVKYFK